VEEATIIPLKLLDSIGRVIWINRSPQSVRFCRPLKIEMIKETQSHIRAEKKPLDSEIENLVPFGFTDEINSVFPIHFELKMTLIDGKVYNILTERISTQPCPICGAKPLEFMTVADVQSVRYMRGLVFSSGKYVSLKTKKKWLPVKKKYSTNYRRSLGSMSISPKQMEAEVPTTGTQRGEHFAYRQICKCSWVRPGDFEIFFFILIAILSNFEIDASKFKSFCAKNEFLYIGKYPW